MVAVHSSCLKPFTFCNSYPAAPGKIASLRKWLYGEEMTRTNEKVRYLPPGKREHLTPATAASGVENILRILEGRWKLVILFHLFGGKVLRFSDLERAIPAIRRRC